MAAKATMGQICDGPMSKNLPDGMFYLCAKFHALIIKPTMRSKYFTYLLHYNEYTHCHNHQTTARKFERSVGRKFGCAPAIFG